MGAAILFFAIGGAALIYAGLTYRAPATIEDPEAYLRSLDYDVEEPDEFQQLLSEPFVRLRRELRADYRHGGVRKGVSLLCAELPRHGRRGHVRS